MKTIPLLILGLAVTTLAFAQKKPSADATALASANNAFACDLYAQLKDAEGNLFFSPFSVSSALAMAYAGAKGDTAAQMQKALRFSDKNLHTSFAELLKHFDDVQRDGSVQLNIANALLPQKGAPLLKDFLALVKQNYGVEITPVDFKHAEPEARARINRWVAEKTHNKIQNIIGAPLDPLTPLVLVNAVYFKGTWKNSFWPVATKEEPFYVWNKQGVKVPLMTQTSSFAYGKQSGSQFIGFPYQGGKMFMLVILPSDKTEAGMMRLEKQLSPKQIEQWRKKAKMQEVEVFLPKFRIEWDSPSLAETLKKLGMQDAFTLGKADFSGMNGKKDLYISDVFQSAFVDVNEEGSEAAAETVIQMASFGIGSEPPPPPPIFRADHPFLFLIQDNATGSILFMGRVVNPTAQ